MVTVNHIWKEAKKIIGNSSDEWAYQRITDAIELCAIKGDFDPLLGSLDICTSSRIVSIPPEIETILGLNMCGQPALARDELFQYHLNGGGSCGKAIRYEWMDNGQAPTYREISCPGQLIGYCVEEADQNAELWVYGFDHNQDQVRTEVSPGVFRDGWKVPVFQTAGGPGANAPFFSRITSVRKPVTQGPIRLTIVNGTEEMLLGVYQSYDTVPLFRRIQMSCCVPWVRIRFRRRSIAVRSRYDLVPVEPAQAVVMMLRAMKAYDEPARFAEGEAFESTAVRWMTERQHTLSSPTVHPMQVLNGADSIGGDVCDQIN